MNNKKNPDYYEDEYYGDEYYGDDWYEEDESCIGFYGYSMDYDDWYM